MDFAKKQLEKYGWSDGKGLGKHENGISKALKPKLKRSVTGIGHDPASEFNEHWWTTLYDKAAGNVEVKEKGGRTKKIKIKDDKFQITNSTYHLNRNKEAKGDEEYAEYFVKTAVMCGGNKTENVREESDSETQEEKKNVLRMTDEELFAACAGRTAHKGARHGLKALGKLARIERQEQMLLTQPEFEGYSQAKEIKKLDQIVEDMNLNSDTELKQREKKKKRKRRITNDLGKINSIESRKVAVIEPLLVPECKKLSEINDNGENEHAVKIKKKKSKRKIVEQADFTAEIVPQQKVKRKQTKVSE